jgi:hypothetical protein
MDFNEKYCAPIKRSCVSKFSPRAIQDGLAFNFFVTYFYEATLGLALSVLLTRDHLMKPVGIY